MFQDDDLTFDVDEQEDDQFIDQQDFQKDGRKKVKLPIGMRDLHNEDRYTKRNGICQGYGKMLEDEINNIESHQLSNVEISSITEQATSRATYKQISNDLNDPRIRQALQSKDVNKREKGLQSIKQEASVTRRLDTNTGKRIKKLLAGSSALDRAKLTPLQETELRELLKQVNDKSRELLDVYDRSDNNDKQDVANSLKQNDPSERVKKLYNYCEENFGLEKPIPWEEICEVIEDGDLTRIQALAASNKPPQR